MRPGVPAAEKCGCDFSVCVRGVVGGDLELLSHGENIVELKRVDQVIRVAHWACICTLASRVRRFERCLLPLQL